MSGSLSRWMRAETMGRGLVVMCCAAMAVRLGYELLVPPELLGGAGSGGSRGLAWATEARIGVGVVTGVLAVAGLALALGRRPLLAGALATITGSVAMELVTFGRGRLFAEQQLLLTMVAGWTLGAWVGTRAGGSAGAAEAEHQVRDAYGFEGLCGALGAAWGLAAVSKLLDGGLGWIDAGTVWHVVFASRDIPMGPDGSMVSGSWLIDAVAGAPALATAMAAAALIIECSAPLLAARGRWRRGTALAIAAMHLGFDVLGGLGHLGMVVQLLLIAAVPSEPLPTLGSPRRALPIGALALLLVALAWALPIDRWLALPRDRRSKAWHIEQPDDAPEGGGSR